MLRFRKEALLKNGSSEHYDDLMRVTRPSHWYVVGVVCIIVSAITVWSFVGELTLKIQGSGIVLSSEGLSEVRPDYNGIIKEIPVQVGQRVYEGQIIALVLQPELDMEIKILEGRIETIGKERILLDQYSGSPARSSRINLLKNILDTTTLSEYALVKVGDVKLSLEELREELIQLQNYSDARVDYLYYQIQELNTQLEEKRKRFDRTTNIRSTANGIIIELALSEGDVFTAAATFCTIENEVHEADELTALIYVDANEAKKLAPGMRVLLSPSVTIPEVEGYLEGYVYFVSKYPATQNGMNRILRNENIVHSLSEDGLPLAVEVRFYTDSTASGYRWTSGKGPEVPLVSGTFTNAIFCVGTSKPVDVFVPFLSSNEKK